MNITVWTNYNQVLTYLLLTLIYVFSDTTSISQADIILVINDTNCYARSQKGVGFSVFAATVFLPEHTAKLFYVLNIYTCDEYIIKHRKVNLELPFYVNRNISSKLVEDKDDN